LNILQAKQYVITVYGNYNRQFLLYPTFKQSTFRPKKLYSIDRGTYSHGLGNRRLFVEETLRGNAELGLGVTLMNNSGRDTRHLSECAKFELEFEQMRCRKNVRINVLPG